MVNLFEKCEIVFKLLSLPLCQKRKRKLALKKRKSKENTEVTCCPPISRRTDKMSVIIYFVSSGAVLGLYKKL